MWKQASALAALTIASFVILLIYALLNLVAIQSELHREIGESNLWAAAQAEREAQQLMLALAGGGADEEDNDAGLRFEILYSRVALLADGPQLAYFRSIGEEGTVLQARRLVEELDQTAARGADEDRQFFLKTAKLAAILRNLANTTNLQERTERLERRDDQSAAMRLLLTAVLGVFVTGAIMAGLLLRNMRRLVLAQETLERHQASLEGTIATRTRELREALDVERRARDVYRSFIVTVSHQFRTPVSIIHMIAQRQIRGSDTGGPEALRRKFARILDAAERLERLLSGFLSSASAEGKDVTLSRRMLDLNDVVAAAVGQIRDAHPDRTVQTDLGKGLMRLDGDPVLLEQVVLNLLSNAVKYSPPPAPVRVSTRREGHLIQCSVSDQGVGIPADAQPAIFERFYRAPNVHRLPGVGVGLSLAHDIVLRHGGVISFTSQEDVGSTFTVALPETGGRKDEQGRSGGDDPLHRG